MSDFIEKDPTEVIEALGVSRQVFAMGATRGLARELVNNGAAFSEAAGDAAVRLMVTVCDPDNLTSETVTVRRDWITVMLAAYLMAADTHAAITPQPRQPKGPLS